MLYHLFGHLFGLVSVLVLGACSRGGYEAHDGASAPLDLAADLVSAADLQRTPDAADGKCITSFSCDARTAEHDCGVTTATGQRYPELGAPYCMGDKTTRQGCSCNLVRCESPMPLCPGTYQAVFAERLIAGCDGIPNMLSGTCSALWNTVQTWPAAVVVSDRSLLNIALDWASADYQQAFKLLEPSQVRVTVQQNCWFADVSGVGNAGRSEVSKITIMAQ